MSLSLLHFALVIASSLQRPQQQRLQPVSANLCILTKGQWLVLARATSFICGFAGTMVVLLVPGNDTGTCLQGCYKGDCGPGTDNYLNLASSCDERLSQLWLISNSNRQLVNVASGYCLSITSENVVTLAACGNELPAQTWSLYANGTLEPASNPGDFLTLCEDGVAGCDPKIMQLISSEGQLTTIAPPSRTGVMASETWEQLSPSKASMYTHAQSRDCVCKAQPVTHRHHIHRLVEHHMLGKHAGVNGSLIQNYWQTASNSGSASFTAAVSASTPWCMQRCSNGDCGDAALDSSLVISSVCDERLDQMWHNDSGTIRSVLNDDCVTICGITSTEAAEAQGDASLAVTCTGAGSDYYNIEARPCTGAANQQWQWQATAVGDVLFSVHTQQAITVCSDLEPWCGYLLLLSFDSSWSARRLTGVRLPSNLSAITQFQTFQPGALTKSMVSTNRGGD